MEVTGKRKDRKYIFVRYKLVTVKELKELRSPNGMHLEKKKCTITLLLVGHLVKNLPAMQETQVQFLGQEDPLEKGQAAHSSILRLPCWFSW